MAAIAATVLALCSVVIGLPATAIGAQGIDLAPLLPRIDGMLTLAVADGAAEVPLRLTSTAEEPRQVSMQVVSAGRDPGGAFVLGAPIEDAQVRPASVEIPAGGGVTVAALVPPGVLAGLDASLVAVVMEVSTGGNVVPRAATVMQVVAGAATDGGTAGRPAAPVAVATALLLVVSAAWTRTAVALRREPSHPDPQDAH